MLIPKKGIKKILKPISLTRSRDETGFIGGITGFVAIVLVLVRPGLLYMKL